MKSICLLSISFLIASTTSAQFFKNDDIVEVDPLLSDSVEGSWKKASMVNYDTVAKFYTVKLDDKKITIPSRTPEKWIRPYVNKQVLNKYGPGARIPYQRRDYVMKNIRCNPSEAGVKKNILYLMAAFYKDYTHISVDVTSFKGQNGYDDPKIKGQFIYPYKIEMLVHLKRTLFFGGKPFTEYQTWEFDRVYEYVSKPGKKCDFYALPSNDARLRSQGWY